MNIPVFGKWTKCSEQLPEHTWNNRKIGDGIYRGNGSVCEELCLVSYIEDITEPPPIFTRTVILSRKLLNDGSYIWWHPHHKVEWKNDFTIRIIYWMPLNELIEIKIEDSEWLEMARQISDKDVQEANYIIHSNIDRLFRNAKFKECNEILKRVDVEKDSPDILLSFLVATRMACEHLPHRSTFYDNCYERLKPVVTTYGVLDGLKGRM